MVIFLYRILALEKLGAVFNQVATPLRYTPRKFVIHPQSNNLVIIESDHNAFTDTAKEEKKQQIAEVSRGYNVQFYDIENCLGYVWQTHSALECLRSYGARLLQKLRFVSVSPISYLLKPSFLVNTTFCELLVRSSLTNHYSWRNLGHYEEGGKFLKKLWRASVLDYNRVIWFYQLSRWRKWPPLRVSKLMFRALEQRAKTPTIYVVNSVDKLPQFEEALVKKRHQLIFYILMLTTLSG